MLFLLVVRKQLKVRMRINLRLYHLEYRLNDLYSILLRPALIDYLDLFNV